MNAVSTVEIRLPKLGESIVSATVIQWMKKPGDWVEEDDPLLEVATDKVNSEIPSPTKGRLVEIIVDVDQEVEVGAVLALLETSDKVEETSEPEYHSEVHASASTTGFLSPAVLRLVRERGIPLTELDRITGTGEGQRITKRDVEAYLFAKGNCRSTEPSQPKEDVEVVPLTPMRKAISENMARSFHEAPHAYIMTEVDVTDLMTKIASEKEAFLAEHGAKLTITAYLVRAIAKAAAEHRFLNASLDGDNILVKKHVNLGIAVAVGEGLVVPVLKECEMMEIPTIAKAIGDLSVRARTRQLQPDEVVGGSITLTNFGMSGAIMGLPIIRHPEVAIIGIGAIQRKVDLDDQGKPVVRQVISATLTFDHRAVDGMYAGAFLKTFKEAMG